MSLPCRVCRRNSAKRAASPSLQVRTPRLGEGELGCSRVRAAVWPGLSQPHAESFRECDTLTATQEAGGTGGRRGRTPGGLGDVAPGDPWQYRGTVLVVTTRRGGGVPGQRTSRGTSGAPAPKVGGAGGSPRPLRRSQDPREGGHGGTAIPCQWEDPLCAHAGQPRDRGVSR